MNCRFVYAIAANNCGEAVRGGVARQRREFKTYRKSTAQHMYLVSGNPQEKVIVIPPRQTGQNMGLLSQWLINLDDYSLVLQF